MKTTVLLPPVLAALLAASASAELTCRWALNETPYDFGLGVLESVSGSRTAQLWGDVTGVLGNPGVDVADRAFLFKGNAANSAGNGVSTGLKDVLPATGAFSVFVTAKFATNYQGGGRMLFSNNYSQGAGRLDFGINGTAGVPNQLTFFLGAASGGTNLAISFTDSVATPVLFDGGWHEVGISRTGNTFQLYVDGAAQGSAGTSSLAVSTNTNYLIGRRTAYTGFFNNLISEVQVFNEARTSGVAILPYDSDLDDIGDTWELIYFILPGEDPVADFAAILARCDAAGDLDGDGVTNLAEYTGGTHPGDTDSDDDGLGDGAETGTGTWISAADTGTSPVKPDSDGDGLLDGQENNTGTYASPTDTGTDPNLADTDADTFNDYLEISRASDPTAAASTPGASAADPLVEMDAAALAAGPLAEWSNSGTLGRTFTADSPPQVESIGGITGVTFYGSEVLTGPVAPSNLTGAAPRTVRAWIFNPTTSTEETIVAWGRRGGPNGTSCAFFHGTDASFGAVGHWGTPDMAWGTDAAAIAANVRLGSWTYVVYTYDGGASNVGNVYSNGALANTELVGALATFAVDNTAAARPLPIRVAGQNAANGSLATDGQKGSLTIHRLEIHDHVLGASELGFNDGDSDGMKDWYEDFYGLDKNTPDGDADPDFDGLANLAEQAAGTNPSLADSDDDGLPDGWEIANFGNQTADPYDDPDDDGAINLDEYEASRGLLVTRDPDGTVTDLTPFTGSSDPNDAASQPDEDDDNLPDGWEYNFLFTLSDGPDDDTDDDDFDNEAEFLAGSDPYNPLSTPTDTDGDGLPDAWETEKFGSKTAQDGTGDPDGDLCPNLDEFTGNSDPNDPDSQPDNDADTLPDGWELRYFGTLDEDAATDFDGDSFANLAELTAGSNPARPGNTPDNVNDTVQVAIGTSTGLDEYSVQNNTWTFVRPIYQGPVTSVLFHQGSFYVAADGRIERVSPADGSAVTLATRNEGDALAAGWATSTARGMEIGPDGRLYFGTAFGTANGEGVFRLNTDGSGFELFIPRNGPGYELYNTIDVAWHGNSLYATSRGAFDATNRPVYQFDSAGALVATLANSLQGPQGLLIDGDTLWVTGTNANTALVALDTTAAPPVLPHVVRTGTATNPDVVEILGELHVVAYAGSIRKDVFKPALATVLASVGTGVFANDMTVFTSSATPYETWARSYDIDPNAPGGAPADDFDGDGSSNLTEFALGLDPTDGASRFAAGQSGTPAAGLTLTWPSQPGLTFTVRSSTDLTDWSTVEATVPAAAAPATTTSWTSGPPAGPRRFFRVEFTP